MSFGYQILGFGAGGAGVQFLTASGGTESTSGDYKIHTFTSPGTFSVSEIGLEANNEVSYLTVGGGGGSGNYGGSGAGGFREYKSGVDSYTASPLDGNPGGTSITVAATDYPITVGSGAAGAPRSGINQGSPSIFSNVTSAGGGGGGTYSGTYNPGGNQSGGPGGSGGGMGSNDSGSGGSVGAGNTPSTTPPQGNNGGPAPAGYNGPSGAGGGALAAGGPANGGAGAGTEINPSPTIGTPGPSGPLRYFAGGGAGTGGSGGVGGGGTSGGTDTAGGGAGSGTGGAGVVVIRYKVA